MKTHTARLSSLALVAWLASPARAETPAQASTPPTVAASTTDEGWPRTFAAGADTITVYHPQVDRWDRLRLEAHAAFALRKGGAESEPAFGVYWLSARTRVDKEARRVTLDNYLIEKVYLPSAPDEVGRVFQALQQRAQGRSKAVALDRLESSLAVGEAQRRGNAERIQNQPPDLVFATAPMLLVQVDGDPAWRPVASTGLMRLVNTRPLLLRDEKGAIYLRLFDGWVSAPTLDGPWSVASAAPSELEEVMDELEEARAPVDLLDGAEPDENGEVHNAPSLARDPLPSIRVVTRPTELVVTEGEPDFAPVDGTDLLYVRNTTGNVFKHVKDQKTYVLVSGRWFRASSTRGPWEFVSSRDLPGDFAAIPDESAKENVKASIAGTPQAQEATIADAIPQTATVKRGEAKLTAPLYDGELQLRAIEGTPLQYVVNSPLPVIRVDPASWYTVDGGVWFVATSPHGPWVVAGSVPAVIYTIPTSSPLHFVTYVRVYDATPETVVVGYTPGYYGTFVTEDGVVVYGTGYDYDPWIGTWWYGWPVTYGLGVNLAWTPWHGWHFGFGFGRAWGPIPVRRDWCLTPWFGGWGWGWGHGGWWDHGSRRHDRGHAEGPRAHPGPRGGPAPRGGQPGPRDGIGRRDGIAPRGGPAPRDDQRWPKGGTSGNVYRRWQDTRALTPPSPGAGSKLVRPDQIGDAYNSRTGKLAAGQRATIDDVLGKSGEIRGEPSLSGLKQRTAGDVFATRDGQIFRQGADGWQRYERGAWGKVDDAERARSLERERAARSTGDKRSESFRSTRERSASPPAGARTQGKFGTPQRSGGTQPKAGGGTTGGGGKKR